MNSYNKHHVRDLIITILTLHIVFMSTVIKAEPIYLNHNFWQQFNHYEETINASSLGQNYTFHINYNFDENKGIGLSVAIDDIDKIGPVESINPTINYSVKEENSNEYNVQFQYDETFNLYEDKELKDYGCKFATHKNSYIFLTYINPKGITKNDKFTFFIIINNRKFILKKQITINEMHHFTTDENMTSTTIKSNSNTNTTKPYKSTTRSNNSKVSDSNKVKNNTISSKNDNTKFADDSQSIYDLEANNEINKETTQYTQAIHNSSLNSIRSKESIIAICIGSIFVLIGLILVIYAVVRHNIIKSLDRDYNSK